MSSAVYGSRAARKVLGLSYYHFQGLLGKAKDLGLTPEKRIPPKPPTVPAWRRWEGYLHFYWPSEADLRDWRTEVLQRWKREHAAASGVEAAEPLPEAPISSASDSTSKAEQEATMEEASPKRYACWGLSDAAKIVGKTRSAMTRYVKFARDTDQDLLPRQEYSPSAGRLVYVWANEADVHAWVSRLDVLRANRKRKSCKTPETNKTSDRAASLPIQGEYLVELETLSRELDVNWWDAVELAIARGLAEFQEDWA